MGLRLDRSSGDGVRSTSRPKKRCRERGYAGERLQAGEASRHVRLLDRRDDQRDGSNSRTRRIKHGSRQQGDTRIARFGLQHFRAGACLRERLGEKHLEAGFPELRIGGSDVAVILDHLGGVAQVQRGVGTLEEPRDTSQHIAVKTLPGSSAASQLDDLGKGIEDVLLRAR